MITIKYLGIISRRNTFARTSLHSTDGRQYDDNWFSRIFCSVRQRVGRIRMIPLCECGRGAYVGEGQLRVICVWVEREGDLCKKG